MRKLAVLLIVALLALTIAPMVAADNHMSPLRLQLQWVTQAQFAGYLVAKAKGFYTEENLDVTILPGAVIGEPGFAVSAGPDGPVQMPHLGRVIVQDRVRIGAGVTVDRGLFADTLLSEGAKIDNLSHIAHNVVVGRNVVMAAFAGISGSSRIGDGVMLGGRVGVADHLEIGAGAQIAAGSAVLSDVPAGETWGGYPAKPLRRFLREAAWLSKAAGRGDAGR
mgnify:CR=1 FL=1